MKFKSLIFTLVLALNSNSVLALTSQEKEILTWSYTRLAPIWIEGGLSQKYCQKNLNYFRGCFASLDMLAQQINPNYRLLLNAEVQGRPVVDSTESFKIVDVGAPVDKFFPQQEREFWISERSRYKHVLALDYAKVSFEIEVLAKNLLKQKTEWLPYQVARVVNAASMYTYDPQTHYHPTFRHDGSRVAIPKPGPGFQLEATPHGWIVQQLQLNSLARNSGIRRGDFVESIDGKAVVNLDVNALEALLTKPENSKANVVFNRNGQRLQRTLPMKFEVPQDFGIKELQYQGQKFSYLGIENTKNTATIVLCSKIAKQLMKFEKETRGLIFDLRGQSNEQPDLAACLSGFFLGSKQEIFVVQSIDDPAQTYIGSTSSKTIFWKPVVILQDEITEGSFELFSGAMQLAGRAYVIGKTTKGNGTEYSQSTIDRLDRFETSYLYYLPNGESHHNNGITPDLEINRHEVPNYYEKYALKMSEIGTFPLKAGKHSPLNFKMGTYALNKACADNQDIRNNYRSQPDSSENKDLQIQSALAILYCTEKPSF